jgi:hypothetical protein
MKLYEIPKGSKIKEDCFNDKGEKIGSVIIFHHIDGMYSYCRVEGVEGERGVIHLSASTSLRKVGTRNGAYYKILFPKEIPPTKLPVKGNYSVC